MGSMADLKYSKQVEKQAEEIGYWVAKKGAVLIFGAEKDYDSLSTAACRGAKRAGGFTVGITYGKDFNIREKNVDVIIPSGLERGGGREFSLVTACDGIITIGGGSGTLNEITVAYQLNRPIVALKGSGGWSDKLAGKYLDERKRMKIEFATSPEKAIEKVIILIEKKSI